MQTMAHRRARLRLRLLVVAAAAIVLLAWSGIAQAAPTGINQSFIATLGSVEGVAADGTYVYWSNHTSGRIGRAKLDGSSVDNNFITGLNSPYQLAVDAGHIYWASLGAGSVGRANIDGSGANDVFIPGIAGNIVGVAVDAGHIYWAATSAGRIGRANLDGTGVNTLFLQGLNGPKGIAVDAGHIYWATQSAAIGRANVDGTAATNTWLTSPGGINITFVAVDPTHIYWTDWNGATNTVGRANLDGTGIDATYVTGAGSPTGVVSTCKELYWGKWSQSFIGHATIDPLAQPCAPLVAYDPLPPVLQLPGDTTVVAAGPAGATVTFSATATDAHDGAVAAVCDRASGSVFALGVTLVSCSAQDAAGNVAVGSFPVAVVLSGTPDTTITSAPTPSTTSRTAPLVWTASLPSSRFECSLDGAAFAACSSPRTYNGLALGPHTFAVRAVRNSLVDPLPAVAAWTIVPPAVAPETTFTLTPPPVGPQGDSSFAWTADQAGATFQCSLDGAAFTACSSGRTYHGLARGSHTLLVRAIGSGGLVEATPATWTWSLS